MRSVLIVDDNATFRAAARGVLEAGGFRVVAEADSGAAAVEAAVRTQPDVVLLDIGLPDMDGFRTCRQVLTAVPTTMVVLCSVRDAEEYGDAVSRSSAAGFLPKAALSGSALSRIITAATNDSRPGHPPGQG
ncbi:response regulator transcription factor [Actinocrispum sp. NPDC049592]|uniref:response regulator n=1 Tax=Actinocrispum sp. NPDC049592 TaxID=3154835 RepID=UPI00341FE080